MSDQYEPNQINAEKVKLQNINWIFLRKIILLILQWKVEYNFLNYPKRKVKFVFSLVIKKKNLHLLRSFNQYQACKPKPLDRSTYNEIILLHDFHINLHGN